MARPKMNKVQEYLRKQELQQKHALAQQRIAQEKKRRELLRF